MPQACGRAGNRAKLADRRARTLKLADHLPTIEEPDIGFTQEPPLNAVSSIALSGLTAATARLGASAHNIANLGTAGFQRQLVQQTAQPGGGVTTRTTQAAVPGSAIEDDMVGMLVAKHSFLANLAVFKTADAMAGELLDREA